MTSMTMRTVSAVTLFLAVAATYAHADSQNSVPMPRDSWPATVVYDVSLANCDKMGGQMGAKPSRGIQVCYISSASCEGHAGFKVVMRDAFTIGGSRLAACRKMH